MRSPAVVVLLLLLATSHSRASSPFPPSLFSSPSQSCATPVVDPPSVTRNGDDIASIQHLDTDTLDDCASLCCFTSNCVAFSFNSPQPETSCVTPASCCQVGSTCCMLKNALPPPTNNTYGKSVQTGYIPQSTGPALPGPSPPFPPSTLVTNVSFSDVGFYAGTPAHPTGDTWPSAWAVDGTVFAWGCDLNASDFTPMALFEIAGDPYAANTGPSPSSSSASDPPSPLTPEVVAYDPIDYASYCAQYGATGSYPKINTKPAGMLALPSPPNSTSSTVLYLGVSCINYGTDLSFTRQTNLGGFLVSSTDDGRTWANVTAVGAFPGRFGAPVFTSCGRANDACAGLDGGYLYVFFPGSFDDASYWSNNDAVFLARTTPSHVAAPNQYQFFAGLDVSGGPTWNTDANVAQPALIFGSMLGDNAVSYNPYIGRYVMGNFGFIDALGRPRPYHSRPFMEPHRSQLLILEAPKPWGPWSVAYRSDDSPQAAGLYTPTFPSAYMRPLVPGPLPGTSTAQMVMFFSCLGGAENCRYTLNYQVVNLTLSVAPAPATNDDLDCYYNGVWDPTTSTCACLPGWAAPNCRTLSLLPAAPLSAASQTYFYPSDAAPAAGTMIDNSWGIRMLPGDGDGLLHGFMTELEGNCSLSSYGTASRVMHVTTPLDAPGGPYTVVDVALDHFAHNPSVVRDVDGAWLIYSIGSPLPNCTIACPGGKPSSHGTCTGSSHGTSVARSATGPSGPWERLSYILPDNETNPSPIVLPNGTIFLTARRWTYDVPVYISETGWRGPYVKTVLPLTTLSEAMTAAAAAAAAAATIQPLSAGAGLQPTLAANTTFFDEDPHLFVNALGYAHMLTHRQPSGTSCSPTGPTPDDCRCGGGHLFAPTLMGPWYADPLSIFNCTLEVEGQSGPVELHARQRPYLFFPGSDGSANASSCPLLFTGASTDPVSQYYSSFTMVQSAGC
jgi:hypothetical protein